MNLNDYLKTRVDPLLHDDFRRVHDSQAAHTSVQACLDHRTRIVLKDNLGGAVAITPLNQIWIDRRSATIDPNWRVATLAHEARHVLQGGWSTSFEREIDAYCVGAQIVAELGLNFNYFNFTPSNCNDTFTQLVQRVRAVYPPHPLYGAKGPAPLRQKHGLADVLESAKQLWLLLIAQRNWSTKL